MMPYAAKVLPKEDIEVFEKIKLVMERLPDISLPDGREVSCHMIARALSAYFPVLVEDGYFAGRGWTHSWLKLNSGNIIDPYPWACVGGPILIDTNRGHSPWNSLYVRSSLDRDLRTEIKSVEFVRDTNKISELIGQILKEIPA